MRKLLFLLLVIITSSVCWCQEEQFIDSLKRVIDEDKQDTSTVNKFIRLAYEYHYIGNDSLSLIYSTKATDMSVRIQYALGEAKVKYLMALMRNNDPTALSLTFDCLKVAEALKDTVRIIDCLFRINLIYKVAEDYENCIRYSLQGLQLAKAINDSIWIWDNLYSVGNGYAYMNEADSALYFYQEAYRYANLIKKRIQNMFLGEYDTPEEELIGWSLHGLGRAQQGLENEDLALGYYFKGLAIAKKQPNKVLDSDIEMSITECFLQMNKVDSVIKYGQLCLERASNLKYPLNILGSYSMLAAAYEGKNNDSAVKYYKMEAAMRSKQFSAKNKSEITNLTFLEQERQNEIIAQQNKLRMERNRSLQFASIGIVLIAFLIFCLFISRSIIVKSGLVKFLGVLSLLLVFEFVNLWIHPVIGDFTHHSPLWMFLIMVSIAALLVPAHHKLEKWITHLLIEKNKHIRLTAAKRTIQELEGR